MNFVTYNQYVGALSTNSNKNATQTTALSSLNTFDAGPYGTGNVEVTSALGTNLGFSGMTGITAPPNATSCTLGTTGCYNVFVTVTNDPGTPLYYDNLGGTEPADAYDFYSVVGHEANEALGTSSCVSTNTTPESNQCGAGTPSAVDLFRYSSAGTLASISAPSTTPGQYFSYDGGNTNPLKGVGGSPLFYNTLDIGDDYADYVSSNPCQANYAIQDAEGCPGFDAGRSILNDGGSEITILNVLGYNLPATKTSQTITFGALPNVAYGVSPFMLKATASSGLPVTYTVSGPASVSGSVLTVKGAGTVTVTASQAGNGTYAAATPVKQSFTVAKATLTATANSLSKSQGSANPTLTYLISGFVNTDTSSVVSGSASLSTSTTATTTSPAGKYPITFAAKGLLATNYNFSYVSGTLTVTAMSARADLLLRINLSPTSVRQGDLLTYAFPVWDLGPDSAVHEVLNTQVPAGTTFDSIRISGTPGLGTCTQPAHGATGPVVCHENSSMASNTTWTVRVTVKVTAGSGSVIKEGANVTEDTPDPNLANNTATVSTTVQ